MLSAFTNTLAAAAEAIIGGWPAPCHLRVHAFCSFVGDPTNGAAATTTLQLYKNSVFSLTGATALLSTAIVHTATLSGKVNTLSTTDCVNSTAVLSRATRDIAPGEFLLLSGTQSAGSGLDISAWLVVVVRGHSNNEREDD